MPSLNVIRRCVLPALALLLAASACVSGRQDDADPRETAAAAAYRSNQFADAANLYEELLAEAPEADSAATSRLRSRLADTYYEWALADALAADQAQNPAGYAEAVARCRQATAADPARNRKFAAAAANFSRRMNTLAYERAVALAKLDPDGGQRRQETALLMAQAETLFAAGRLQAAREKYHAVLALDPYHRAALSRLQRLAGESRNIARERRRTDTAERLAEAEWRYVQPPVASPPPASPGERSLAVAPPSLEQRLDGIIYRRLNFDQTPLTEVIAALRSGSQVPEAPGGVAFRCEGLDPTAPQWPTVTFHAENIPLRDALSVILPPLGLRFQVASDAVVISPSSP